MIFIDKENLVFIHIPKNGGSSIRKSLIKSEIDFKEIGDIIKKIPVDYDNHHITLKSIFDISPQLIEKLKESNVFVIIRNPMDRFYSSLVQYTRLNYGKLPDEIPLVDLKVILSEIIHYLKDNKGKVFHKNFVHFQPQIDYVYLDGIQVAKNTFSLEKINNIVPFLASKGVDINLYEENKTYHISNRQLSKIVRKLYRIFHRMNLLPSQKIIRFFARIISSGGSAKLDKKIQELPVKSFVKEYYRSDIILWKSL